MYICSDCGAMFDEPAFVTGRDFCPDELVCPVCGQAFDAEEAQMCNLCGEYHHPNDMASEHCCKACARERMTLPITKRYLAERNGRTAFYVEFMLDSIVEDAGDALKDLAERHFDGLPVEDKVKYLRDFVEQEMDCFAAWLEDADNV